MYDFDDDKKKQSRGTEAILNALLLALDDRFARPPGTERRHQESHGDPLGHPDHRGKTQRLLGVDQFRHGSLGVDQTHDTWVPALAAIAVGSAPGNGLSTHRRDSQERLDSLRDYLKKQLGRQNLHNRVWMLWASATYGRIANTRGKGTADRADPRQAASRRRLEPGFARRLHARERQDPVTAPDGYATGLILHVLQVAGIAKEIPTSARDLPGCGRIKIRAVPGVPCRSTRTAHPSRRDPAKAHVGKFMWDAATAYSVLALSH